MLQNSQKDLTTMQLSKSIQCKHALTQLNSALTHILVDLRRIELLTS